MSLRVSARSRAKQKELTRLVFCPSCSIWRLVTPASRTAHVARAPLPHLRSQTRGQHHAARSPSIAPTTAINAPANVRPEFLPLYAALDALKRDAGSYVNLSQLGLALRGLQNDEAVVRVALLTLGEGSQAAARRLARVLLADPLGDEGTWEQRLEKEMGQDGRAILLRYGNEDETAPHNPLLHTVFVPSRVLQKHHLELLITNLNADVLTKDAKPSEAILVPALQIPVSMTGRTGIVTNPVHKAIIFGNGISSGVDYGRFVGAAGGLDVGPETATVALNMPVEAPSENEQPDVIPVNVDRAAEALAEIRKNNPTAYEHGWMSSNVSPLSKWLASDTSTSSPSTLKPAVQRLAQSLLEATSESMDKPSTQRKAASDAPAISPETQASILAALDQWAEAAHTELRDGLEVAFLSRAWNKIKWWKLIWRVDDVSGTAADLLLKHWLVEAEKNIVFLGGRMEEAGFFKEVDEETRREMRRRVDEWEDRKHQLDNDEPPPEASSPSTNADKPTSTTTTATKGDPATTPDRYGLPLPTPPLALPPNTTSLFTLSPPGLRNLYELLPADAKNGSASTTPFPVPHLPKPYPQHIPLARAHLAAGSIPPLEAAAQQGLARALGGTAASGVVGALVYASEVLGAAGVAGSTAGYEAGAVALFGAVWVLRRVQARWEAARRAWRREVELCGREALVVSEQAVRGVVARAAARGAGARGGVDAVDEEVAREAVRKAEAELRAVSAEAEKAP